MDFLELAEKVKDSAGLASVDEGKAAARAVFTILEDQISYSVRHSVERELTGDIKLLWRECAPKYDTEVEELPPHEHAHEHAYGEPLEFEANVQSEGAECARLEQGEYDSSAVGPAAASVVRDDKQVAREVRELLDANDEVDAGRINVEVHAGKVILRGKVHDRLEKNAAVQAAHLALGVKEVIDELKTE